MTQIKKAFTMTIIAVLLVLTSCSTGSSVISSSSSEESSQNTVSSSAISLNKTNQFDGKIDLRASSDLSMNAYAFNDSEGGRMVLQKDGAETVIFSVPKGYVVFGTEWSPNDKYILFFAQKENDIAYIYDVELNKIIDTGMTGFYGRFVLIYETNKWSGTSDKIVLVDLNGSAFYWDIKLNKAIKFITPENQERDIYRAGFSPNGEKIAYMIENQKETIVKVYECKTGTHSEVFRLTGKMDCNGAPQFPVWISNTEFLFGKLCEMNIYKTNILTGKTAVYIDNTYAVKKSPDNLYLVYDEISKTGDYNTIIKEIASGQNTIITDGQKFGEPVWAYDSKKLLLCTDSSISVIGLNGNQIGETIPIPQQYSYYEMSTPVYTKDGIWYEGKD